MKGHPIRLTLITLFGAGVGWVAIADYIFTRTYGYHHGMGEGWWCDAAGTFIGTAIGLASEAVIRIFDAARKP